MSRKKILPILLALVLMLSTTASVFGTDYYEEWGSSWDWTDAQWEASNSWTEAEWDAYYAAEQKAWDKEYKESMGFTNMDGINVFFDGVCLDFKDVKPVIKNGSTMVPFRSIFEAFGATVDYKQTAGDKIITASLGDIALSLTVGQATMIVKNGATDQTITLPSSPYIDGSRSYVPLRAISEGLGYDVLWNEWAQVVEVIDGEKFIAAIDKNFSLYNRIISDSLPDWDKTFKTKGNMAFDAIIYGDEKHSKGSFKTNYTALQKGLSVDLKGSAQLDLNDFSETLTAVLGEDMMKKISAAKNTPLEFIMCGDNFEVFLKSSLMGLSFSELSDELVLGDNDWLKLSLKDFANMASPVMSEDYLALLKDPSTMTFGSLVYASSIPGDGNSWTVNVYNQMKTSCDLAEIFFGDKNFVKKGSSYVLKMDRMAMMKQIAPVIMSDIGEADMGTAMEVLSTIPEAQYTLTLTEKNGLLSDMDLSGHVKVSGLVPVTISFKANGDKNSSTSDFSIVGRYFGKILLHADSVSTESTETLRTAPTAGENVYDFSELFNSLPEESTIFDEEPVVEETSDSAISNIIPKPIMALFHNSQRSHTPYQ